METGKSRMTRSKPCSRLLETDYRTSTGVGHCFIHPVEQTHEHVEWHLKNRDPQLLQETYTTTNIKAHDHKYVVRKNTEMAELPILCARQAFMQNIDEKLKMNDWFPLKIGDTEYSSQYIQKEVVPLVERERAPGPASVCLSRGLGRDEQPAVPPGINSFAKFLDPYVSTTHLTHTQFSNAQLHGVARSDALTFYNSEMMPDLSIRKEPVYDTLVFKNKACNRIVPKLVCRVPHKGLQSEMQAKYVNPYHHEFSSETWDCGTEFPVTIPAASPWETLSAPYMYCTEYCHIGTGWPIREVVNPGSRRS